jgi:hypothetical protein
LNIPVSREKISKENSKALLEAFLENTGTSKGTVVLIPDGESFMLP